MALTVCHSTGKCVHMKKLVIEDSKSNISISCYNNNTILHKTFCVYHLLRSYDLRVNLLLLLLL